MNTFNKFLIVITSMLVACSFVNEPVYPDPNNTDYSLDFSPLKLGNTWKYIGKNSSLNIIGWGGSDSILRKISVTSNLNIASGKKMEILFIDSLFHRTRITPSKTDFLPDTIEYLRDTLIDSSNIIKSNFNWFFDRHKYPDSLIHKEIRFGSRNFLLTDTLKNFRPSSLNLSGGWRIFVQGIGLLELHAYSTIGTIESPHITNDYKLIELNGENLSDHSNVITKL